MTEDYVKLKFACSIRERAAFEAGIKLGTIYHQFIGTPVNAKNVKELENTIEKTILIQPFTKSVKIKINIPNIKNEYNYKSLTGDMLDVSVNIVIDNTSVTAEMRYDKELNYPLMYISDISD